MKTVTESFVLPCTPEVFWKQFFDESYSRALFMEQLQFKSFTVIELKESSRKLRLSPKINLPGVLEKLIGDSFAYEEHGTLDRAKSVWTWQMVQPAGVSGKPKVATHGTIRVEPAPDGKCRRTDEVVIEARIFGLGGIIESTVEKELRSSWAKELPFFEQWLKK
jgi:hypothetical protein